MTNKNKTTTEKNGKRHGNLLAKNDKENEKQRDKNDTDIDTKINNLIKYQEKTD